MSKLKYQTILVAILFLSCFGCGISWNEKFQKETLGLTIEVEKNEYSSPIPFDFQGEGLALDIFSFKATSDFSLMNLPTPKHILLGLHGT